MLIPRTCAYCFWQTLNIWQTNVSVKGLEKRHLICIIKRRVSKCNPINPRKREVMELEEDHIRESLVKMETEIGVMGLHAKECRQAPKSGHDMRKNHSFPGFPERAQPEDKPLLSDFKTLFHSFSS